MFTCSGGVWLRVRYLAYIFTHKTIPALSSTFSGTWKDRVQGSPLKHKFHSSSAWWPSRRWCKLKHLPPWKRATTTKTGACIGRDGPSLPQTLSLLVGWFNYLSQLGWREQKRDNFPILSITCCCKALLSSHSSQGCTEKLLYLEFICLILSFIWSCQSKLLLDRELHFKWSFPPSLISGWIGEWHFWDCRDVCCSHIWKTGT